MRPTLLLLLALCVPFPAFGRVLIPIYRNYDLIVRVSEHEARKLTLVVVAPTDPSTLWVTPALLPARIRQHLEWLHEPVFRPMFRVEMNRDIEALRVAATDANGRIRQDFVQNAILENSAKAFKLLRVGHDFALSVYRQMDKYKKNGVLPQGILDDVGQILSGNHALVLIMDHMDPGRVFQTLSVAYPDSQGLVPLQHRLKKPLQEFPLPVFEPTLSQVTQPFLSTMALDRSFPLADKLYNLYPVYEAGRVELKMYVRDPKSEVPWGNLLRRFIFAQGLIRILPQDLPRQLHREIDQHLLLRTYGDLINQANRSGDHLERIALQKAFYDVAGYMETSVANRLWAKELVVDAVGRENRALYQRFYDLKDQYGPKDGSGLEDPDVPPERAYVIHADRNVFETKALNPDRWYPDDEPLGMTTLTESLFSTPFPDDTSCAFVISRHESMVNLAGMHTLRERNILPPFRR